MSWIGCPICFNPVEKCRHLAIAMNLHENASTYQRDDSLSYGLTKAHEPFCERCRCGIGKKPRHCAGYPACFPATSPPEMLLPCWWKEGELERVLKERKKCRKSMTKK